MFVLFWLQTIFTLLRPLPSSHHRVKYIYIYLYSQYSAIESNLKLKWISGNGGETVCTSNTSMAEW